MDDDLQNSQLLRSWEVHGSQAVHDTKPSLAEIFLSPFPVIFVYKVLYRKYKLLYLVPSIHYLAALNYHQSCTNPLCLSSLRVRVCGSVFSADEYLVLILFMHFIRPFGVEYGT